MSRLAGGIALVALVAATARADERPPAAHAQEARELARTAIRLYEIGEYDDAIGLFKKSYEADANPAILFNLAQAYRFKRDWTQAERMYENYLRLMPRPPNRAVVLGLINEMKKKAAEEELVDGHGRAARDDTPVIVIGQPAEPSPPPAAPLPPPPLIDVRPQAIVVAPAPPPRRPIYKRWWLWTTVGVVVAAAAVGLGVGLSQNHDYLPGGKLGTIDGR
jgi:tetratricopeptide (TPR) repeat protein